MHGIVSQSGGHISVHSQRGFGAVFEVYLPEVQEESPSRSLGAPARPQVRGSETILLVEDESALRELARQSLEQSGFAVLSIYMSGYADSTLGEIESSACLLQKPFRPNHLTTKAREVLDEAAPQTGR